MLCREYERHRSDPMRSPDNLTGGRKLAAAGERLVFMDVFEVNV